MRIAYLWLLLAFAGLSACKKSNGGSPEINGIVVRDGMDAVGKVMADGQPAEGVVVSDGYSVVRTNAEGIYQLKRHANARFVFISVPADCKIPVRGAGRPDFYRAINPGDEIAYGEFTLSRQPVESEFTLLSIADPQFSDEYEYGRFSTETVPDIVQTRQSAGNTPVYGIILGDLVWDKMNMFGKFDWEFSRIGIPLFTVIGNHDYDMTVKNDDDRAAAPYERQFGPTYYSFNRGDCHFIVLDDIEYNGGGASGKGYEARLSDAQLAWLAKDLYHVPRNKLVIVGLHINTKTRFTETTIANNQALYNALNGYTVKILSGHTHWHGNVSVNNNIREYIHGASCGAFWSGDINRDGAPNGYGVFEISGNQVVDQYYKATARARDYQIKLYPVNSWALRPNDVIANIWDWHTDWRSVKVYENGVLKGDMKQFEEKTARDPYAKWLLDIRGGIVNDDAAGSIITDHLFYYRPTVPDALIRVEATDSYGNTYSAEIRADASPGFPGPV